MQESLLFKNVDIVRPNGIYTGDVFIKDGKIVDVAPSISVAAAQVIHESGLTLIPGVIDPHVHFRDPGACHKEDLYSGSKAAAAGGVTSFFDMPNTNPATTTCEKIAKKKALAAEKSLVNYNFFIGATADNIAELQAVKNVPGIKIYVGSSTGSLLVDEPAALAAIFEKTNHIIAVHSEDEAMIQEKLAQYQGSQCVADHETIRSAAGALRCTTQLIDLAHTYQHRLHICHLTTQEEVAYICALGQQSLVTCEVTPQHALCYSPGVYEEWGTKAQINPPIRNKAHQEALFMGLKEGVIDCVGSDHAPHLETEKDQPFGRAPSGMPGVETALPLLLDRAIRGELSLETLVDRMCAAPARIYAIQNKGALIPGYDADCVLLNLKGQRTLKKETLVSKAKWSIFENQVLQGAIIATFVNGQCVFREGDFFESSRGTLVTCGLG